MENLNAEKVKRALECCTSGNPCRECDYRHKSKDTYGCRKISMIDALALIKSQEQKVKELTEENERLREDNEIKSQKRANIFEIVDAFARGRADGVRKMQERLKERRVRRGNITFKVVPIDDIDQVAKEMLDGE